MIQASSEVVDQQELDEVSLSKLSMTVIIAVCRSKHTRCDFSSLSRTREITTPFFAYSLEAKHANLKSPKSGITVDEL